MGRRSKDWYPSRFNDRRKQQGQRPIAAAPGSTALVDEYPAPTTVPPLSSSNPSMSTPGPSRGSRPRPNRSNENLCMRIRRPNHTVVVARVLLIDHMRHIGISEEFATHNYIFSVELREDRRRYIAEGQDSTGILHARSSAYITILHPGDPSQTTVSRAIVFRPESSTQPSHDVRVPRRMRHLCGPVIENVRGLDFATLSDPGDFNSLLGPQQHTCVSGGAICHPCFDRAMIASNIKLPYQPAQHSLPHRYDPTQASDSPPTMPSYQPTPGAYDGRWSDGIQSTNQWLSDDGQGNDGVQWTNPWLYNDGTQSTSQQPWDDYQGDDDQGDDQGDDGM